MARRPPHDAGDNGRHAAFDRARLGDRNFFWIHAALEFENPALNRRGLGLPMQQDRRRHRSHGPRRSDLRDAGDLFWRIQSGLLGIAPADSSPSHQVSFRPARLSELGGVPESRLAGGHWLALSGCSFGRRRLFHNANADQSSSLASGLQVKG